MQDKLALTVANSEKINAKKISSGRRRLDVPFGVDLSGLKT
jgi:hypothetical protein